MSSINDVPQWIKPGKLRWAWGLWEPLAHYRRQGGDPSATGVWNPRWAAEYYDRMHSEEIVAKLADMGVNLTTTAFFKGFGLEAEADQIELTRQFTEICHSHGIRVLGYNQLTTIIYETMLREVPDLDAWASIDARGEKLNYGNSYWRWFACATCDDHIEYLKRVITKALVDTKLDGVYWDGGPYDCHCSRCQDRFRSYLADKFKGHSKAEIEELFGLPYLDYVRIPTGTSPRDPLYRQLTYFRRDVQHERLVKLHQHARDVNPEAAFVHYVGPTALQRSDGYRSDIIIDENWDLPHVHGESGIINRAHWIKLHQAPGRLVLSTSWFRDPKRPGLRRVESAEEVALDLAEHGAYGGNVIAATWALRPDTPPDGAHFERPELYKAMKRYMQFYRDHEWLYEVKRSRANVGVYASFESQTFDQKRALVGRVGISQALLWRQIPHVVVLSANRSTLCELDTLVISNQTCLSDEEVQDIEAFVRSGKGLVVSGQVGTHDEHFRLRLQPAFEHLRGEDRVVFMPDALDAVRPLSSERKAEFLYVPHLPMRHQEIVDAVTKATGGSLPVRLDAPTTVAADLWETESGGFTLHVINYANTKPLDQIKAQVAWPDGDAQSLSARLYTPDEPQESGASLPFEVTSSGIEFVVPNLQTYTCILIERT